MEVGIVNKPFSESNDEKPIASSTQEKESISSMTSLEKTEEDATKATQPLPRGNQPSLQPNQG